MKTKMKKKIKRIYNSNLFNEFFESEKSTGLIYSVHHIFFVYGKHNLWDAIPSHHMKLGEKV
jgi:NhaA family Na+:H+ antiporter